MGVVGGGEATKKIERMGRRSRRFKKLSGEKVEHCCNDNRVGGRRSSRVMAKRSGGAQEEDEEDKLVRWENVRVVVGR